jgi:phage tail-like protein
MKTAGREPFGNMRFRVEIDGLQETGAVAVIFPEARLVTGPRKSKVIQYGPLILRRGVTRSPEWYEWWDRSRTSRTAPKRAVTVVLIDERRADANRWTFDNARPSGYSLSHLNALGNEPLVETLELEVASFSASFGSATPTRRKRS